jgi:NADH-quinone oxidoreductase subunit M
MPFVPWDSWNGLALICAIIATTGVLLGAIYMLSAVRRVFFGPVTNPDNEHLTDLDAREIGILVPLVVLVFAIGFFPKSFTSPMTASVETVVDAYGSRVEAVRDPRARGGERSALALPALPGEAAALPAAGAEHVSNVRPTFGPNVRKDGN